jgi:hypothetical protein
MLESRGRLPDTRLDPVGVVLNSHTIFLNKERMNL